MIVNRVPSDNPIHVSKFLAENGCNKVLWECGPKLATSAVKAGCIQEFISFIAPKILGGESAMTPFSDFGFNSMQDVLKLNYKEINLVKGDIYLRSFKDGQNLISDSF